MGVRPRYCWAIDVCGMHDADAAALRAARPRRAGLHPLQPRRQDRFWSESPDGSRILTLVPGDYADNLGGSYGRQRAADRTRSCSDVGQGDLRQAGADARRRAACWSSAATAITRSPRRAHENPTEFLAAWKTFRPDCDIRFTALSPYVDALLPGVKSGKIELPTVRAGTGYTFDSFWIESPRVKTWYRRDEHALQAAEMLATIASLKAGFEYPVAAVLSRLAANAAEHGPQHALGRGRRHGVRARHFVGRQGPLRVGRETKRRHARVRRAKTRRRRPGRRAVQSGQLEAHRSAALETAGGHAASPARRAKPRATARLSASWKFPRRESLA